MKEGSVVVVGGDGPRYERVDSESEEIQIGQWFILDGEHLRCVTSLGSNYARLQGIGYTDTRVHFDEFWTRCVREPNAQAIVRGWAQEAQDRVNVLLGRARELTTNLFVGQHEALPNSDTQALAKLNENLDPKAYRNALEKAKSETLPDIFEKIKKEHETIERCMKAELLPMQGELGLMKKAVKLIENRIFSIDLYAGLSEEVELVRDGEPAPYDSKVHLMQRRLYMDEESLLDYKAGGMDFQDIYAFDAWLSQTQNMERLLPFPRCVVAFRVRRHTKDRGGKEFAGLLGAFIRLRLEEADKLTFMYFRNGDKLYRMSTRMTFPEKLFGDDGLKLTEPLWAEMFCSKVQRVITERDYLDRLARHEAAVAEMKAFKERHPDFDYFRSDDLRPEHRRIERDIDRDLSRYVKFTPASVYFDDIKEVVEKEAREHQRIGLIMQGVLDRSPIFHPHPPAELWTQEGFDAAVELVRDATRALHASEELPDFKEYWAQCNASLQTGSVVVGQQKYWRREMVRRYDEDNRRWRTTDRDWDKIPWGNPGPGDVARVEHFQPRARRCRFKWLREKQDYSGDQTNASFTVDADKVFNLDGYTPGDFRRFFEDPRTREQYLKWAFYLLTAEDYHAGRVEVREPGE